jgi:hypothetical protein
MAIVLLFLAEVAAEAVVAEVVGEMVVEEMIASSLVTEVVASDAVMVAAAEASTAALETMAVTIAPEIATVTELATSSAFELGSTAFEFGAEVSGTLATAETTVAVETATSTLAATGETVATTSASQIAATTALEGGATVAEATTAATLTTEGATVTEAVTTATGGTVQTGALTEAMTTASNAVSQLSNAATSLQSTIGQTLLPGASATVQQLAGQVAINTATNGGDFGQALTNALISVGTGYVGSEVAAETGSRLVGQAASSALNSVAHGQDVSLTGLATGALGSVVSSEVADLTGSNLVGQAAGSVTKDLIKGKDPLTGLLTIGANQIGNVVTDQINDFVDNTALTGRTTGTDSREIDETGRTQTGVDTVSGVTNTDTTQTSNDQTVTAFGDSTDVSDIVADLTSANDKKSDAVVGGLNAVTGTNLAGTDTTATVDNTGSLTGTLDKLDATVGTGSTDATSNVVTGDSTGTADVITGDSTGATKTNINDEEADDVVIGTPVTGGLTTASNAVTGTGATGNTLTTADTGATVTGTGGNTTVGGLNTVLNNTDTLTGATGNDTISSNTGSTGSNVGSTTTSGLGSALVKNVIGKSTKSLLGSTAKNAINSAVTGKKMTMPSVSKTLTGNALSAIRGAVPPKVANVANLIPVTKAAPKKVDVSKLTPLKAISGLTSLIKKPG